jgi:hypothetical protein
MKILISIENRPPQEPQHSLKLIPEGIKNETKKQASLLIDPDSFFVSLGGWFLRLRIHPTGSEAEYFISDIAGIISAFITPLLFIARLTTPIAYLMNWMTVYSWENLPAACNISTILFDIIFANIMYPSGNLLLEKPYMKWIRS